MAGVPKSSIVVMTYLRRQFTFPKDDITTIWLQEIVWDIHSGQEGVLALRRRSQAFGPPVDTVDCIATRRPHDIPNCTANSSYLRNRSDSEIHRCPVNFFKKCYNQSN
jgi:hypothetical protein